MNKNGFVNIILIGVIALIIAAAGYFVMRQKVVKTPTLTPQESETMNETKAKGIPTVKKDGEIFFDKNLTEDWKTYRNESFGYSIEIPPKWQVKQNNRTYNFPNSILVPNLTLLPPDFIDSEVWTFKDVQISFPFTVSDYRLWIEQFARRTWPKDKNGLRAIADVPNELPSPYYVQQNSYKKIDGHEALLISINISKSPPSNFEGEWCGGCILRTVFIDLGDDNLIRISTFNSMVDINFEKIFNQILSTFKFIE